MRLGGACRWEVWAGGSRVGDSQGRVALGNGPGALRRCSLSVRHKGRGVCGESMRVNVTPSVQLLEVDEEALIQLSVPAELAQKMLRVLEQRCQGSARCDLRGSHVYAKYFLGREAEQDGGGGPAVSSEGAGCRSTGPEAKAAEEDLSTATVPPRAPAAAAKSDSQLFSELLEREGLFFPEVTEEQIKGNRLLCAGAHTRCQRQHRRLVGGRLWVGHGMSGAQRSPGAGGPAGAGSVGVWRPGSCWGCYCCPNARVPVSLPPALGSCEGVNERGSLAKMAAVVDVVQSSSSEVGLRLAGLKHIVKILEEEPEPEQQVGRAQGGLGTRSVG